MLCVGGGWCARGGAGFGRWAFYHGVKRLGRKYFTNPAARSNIAALAAILHEPRSGESSEAWLFSTGSECWTRLRYCVNRRVRGGLLPLSFFMLILPKRAAPFPADTAGPAGTGRPGVDWLAFSSRRSLGVGRGFAALSEVLSLSSELPTNSDQPWLEQG
jgi:hypothetical protein